jgi:hypothetical protein
MTWNNGDVYNGQWSSGRRNGFGTMKWNNGVTYKGNWHNNKRNGLGELIYQSGKIAKGRWDNDEPIGEFRLTWPNAVPGLPSSIKIGANQLDDIDAFDDVSDASTEHGDGDSDGDD